MTRDWTRRRGSRIQIRQCDVTLFTQPTLLDLQLVFPVPTPLKLVKIVVLIEDPPRAIGRSEFVPTRHRYVVRDDVEHEVHAPPM